MPNLEEGDKTKLEINPGHLHFSADVEDDASKGIKGQKYLFDLDFFEDIEPAHTKKSHTAKGIYLVLRKAKVDEEYWPRLTKDKVRLHNVKTDFDKWVDQDEQDEKPDLDMGGMGGMPDMGAMGGMGGMGGGMDGGGMGGLDMQQLMAQMGGGMGGGGMPDLSALQGEGDEGEEGEEEAEEAKAE